MASCHALPFSACPRSQPASMRLKPPASYTPAAGLTSHKELEALHQARLGAVPLGQGRDLHRVVDHKGGLLQVRLHGSLKAGIQDMPHLPGTRRQSPLLTGIRYRDPLQPSLRPEQGVGQMHLLAGTRRSMGCCVRWCCRLSHTHCIRPASSEHSLGVYAPRLHWDCMLAQPSSSPRERPSA